MPIFPHAINEDDLHSIEAILNQFSGAWNQHNGRGSAHHYTEDADFVNTFGQLFSGKILIEKRHHEVHDTFYKGSKYDILETKVREAKPGVAIAQVHWKISNIPVNEALPLKEIIYGIFTHTLLKNEGKWFITSTQNTLIHN